MATEPLPASYSLDVSTAIAQLRRENERLQHRSTQLEEQVRALLVLQGIANTLSAELNLPYLLRRIAIAALRLTSAHVSAVYLVDSSHTVLIVEAVETLESAADSGIFTSLDFAVLPEPEADEDIVDIFAPDRKRIGVQEGIAGWVATNCAVVLVADATSDPRFTAEALSVDSGVLGRALGNVVAVPMVFREEVTGVLEIAQGVDSEGFDASSLDLMRTLAAQAATAVANAQLYRRLRAERDRIIQTQEDERKRLGRDLHDGPAQKLAQIAMSLEFAEQLAMQDPARLSQELRSIHDLTLSTTREIRNRLFDLRPLVLDAENGGLVVALSQFLERFQEGQGPHMYLQAEYPERLSHNVELTVFAIVQEAVNNVLKHANAHNCWIDIRETDEKLTALISDDGDGFDTHQVQNEYESRGSWGLVSMLERAALIEAKLSIASQLDKGTITSLEVPR